MGKRLIQQRRGRGKGRFKTPSHRYKGDVRYSHDLKGEGLVEEIVHDTGHTAPLARIQMKNGSKNLIISPEGLRTGQTISFAEGKTVGIGNVLPVGKITEGTAVYNIELLPGDGGKMARSAGNYATIISHDKNKTVLQLPSGKFRIFNSNCKASIGVVAGSGRKEKPFLKAGTKHIAYRAKGKMYPVVRGVAMNPVAHPHGGGSHQHVGKPSTVKRGAPPGRKVGNIAAKRTGGK